MCDPVSSNKKTHVSRDVTFHESVPGGILLNTAVRPAEAAVISTTAVRAAEPAVINSPSSSGTSRAVEPVDTGRLSTIDISLDTDTESDDGDDDASGAAAPSGQQSVSQSAVTSPAASERPAMASTESAHPHRRSPTPSQQLPYHQVCSSPTSWSPHASGGARSSKHCGSWTHTTHPARQSGRASSSTERCMFRRTGGRVHR